MMNRERQYVHGYHELESDRLQAQAGSVLTLLHADTTYPAGSLVLEVGCGTGAQTITLAQNSPRARIVSFDHSASSLAQARARVGAAGITNVEFRQADLFALPFGVQSFDHVFVCFVLEHLSKPDEALVLLERLLKPGEPSRCSRAITARLTFTRTATLPKGRSPARSSCRAGAVGMP